MKARLVFLLILLLAAPGGQIYAGASPTIAALSEQTRPADAQAITATSRQVHPTDSQAVAAPVLKWQLGGCYSSWCKKGIYSSPAVADLDGNGTMEVIGGAYNLFILNGTDGTRQQAVDTPGDGIWPGVVVSDIDDDGDLEIAIAQEGGYVSVFDHTGTLIWTQRPITKELAGLLAYDLNGDGTLEIIVTAARGNKTNTWVYAHNGTLRAGWPQLDNDQAEAWGVYNANATIGDLDGDGEGEIVVPSDMHFICAYEANGAHIQANAIYGSNKAWGAVGVHVDHAVDLRGYAHCGTEHRPNFARSPANIVDVNNDGVLEVVAMGNVYNCEPRPYLSLYEMPFIFNADRTRWSGDGFDWTAIPVPDGNGAPISEDYDVIELNAPNPVTVDLDSDGYLEIIYPSYDGRVHAYWLDKTQHGNWPFAVYPGSGPLRFAAEPAVADLDNDGYAEVLFTTWTQKGSNQTGKFYVLDYLGNPLHVIDLPPAFSDKTWNGGLAAPTLDDIDGDGELEAVINTAYSGFIAYDLPGTANARVLWGTGRGNVQRTGNILQGSVEASTKSVQPLMAAPGDTVAYTIILRTANSDLPTARMTDTLPSGINYLDNLWASSGSYAESGDVITWNGSVSAQQPVTITFRATVDPAIVDPTYIDNVALIDDGQGNLLSRSAGVVVNGYAVYLPLVMR